MKMNKNKDFDIGVALAKFYKQKTNDLEIVIRRLRHSRAAEIFRLKRDLHPDGFDKFAVLDNDGDVSYVIHAIKNQNLALVELHYPY